MKDINLLISNGVNIQKSLELFGDMATYDETLETFLAEVENKLLNIKKYKELADMINYAILVHSLKSDAKYFGFDTLATLAYNHEMQSKANNIYYVCEHYNELIEEANKIVSLVKIYLGKSTPETLVERNTPTNETPQLDKSILIVDDSNIIVKFIENMFSDKYKVIIARDGSEAINEVNNDVNNKIVAMLLDLNMPNVNGYAVLEYFKSNNIFRKIPVSIITGDGTIEATDKVFQYPIVDVLRKPFNERDIKTIVDKTISLRQEQ